MVSCNSVISFSFPEHPYFVLIFCLVNDLQMLVGLVSSAFLLYAPPIMGLPGVWSGLALFMGLRTVAGYMRWVERYLVNYFVSMNKDRVCIYSFGLGMINNYFFSVLSWCCSCLQTYPMLVPKACFCLVLFFYIYIHIFLHPNCVFICVFRLLSKSGPWWFMHEDLEAVQVG
jgi:hypothetical protein